MPLLEIARRPYWSGKLSPPRSTPRVSLGRNMLRMNSRNTKTVLSRDAKTPANPRQAFHQSLQSHGLVLAAIAVLPCMPLAYYTHDPSRIVRCPPYQTKQPLTGARIRAPENVFKWWAGETHLPNMCQLAFDHLSVPAMSSENEC